jgi:hypothetical protein
MVGHSDSGAGTAKSSACNRSCIDPLVEDKRPEEILKLAVRDPAMGPVTCSIFRVRLAERKGVNWFLTGHACPAPARRPAIGTCYDWPEMTIENRTEPLENLKTFLRIPSISALAEHKLDTRRAAEFCLYQLQPGRDERRACPGETPQVAKEITEIGQDVAERIREAARSNKRGNDTEAGE